MHVGELTPAEQRVLGCLIEKRWTTPDQYPLSLNALRLAANQVTNRDPVTDYDESTIRQAAQRLSRYGLARLASGHSSRAVKYRHLAEQALSLDAQPLAVLAVLLLRGPQTPGELKTRTERMASFASLQEVEATLDLLAQRGYARRVARRPGQKEDRFEHLVGATQQAETAPGAAAAAPAEAAPPAGAAAPHEATPPQATPPQATAPDGAGDINARLGALEAEVAALRAELAGLRGEL